MSTSIVFPAAPEQVLKSLGKLWTTLGHEEKEQGKPTVLRACAMTLIVATDEPDSGYAASQTISELMRSHPSRGIVVAISPDAEHGLEARVLAQCWKPFGKAQQICCEQIEILARPDSWPNVGQTLVGLTVADLPVIFWIRHSAALQPGATAEQKAGLQAVLDLASKAILDTAEFEPATAFDLLHRLGSAERAVADLEWTRLTSWRQPIAQIFDNPARTNHFTAFKSLDILYGGEHPTPGTLYFAGWLSQPYRAAVRFERNDDFGPGLHGVRLHAADEHIVLERTGQECLRLSTSAGRERNYALPSLAQDALLEEELSLPGADPVFDRAFGRAQELLIAS